MGISLESKIAQMLMVGFDGYDISKNHYISHSISVLGLGGVILFDLEHENYKLKNIKAPEQVGKLVRDLKSYAGDDKLLVGIDYEGGMVKRLNEDYGFPKTYSHKYLGEINDLSYTFKQALQMSSTLGELGINLNFAPVVDINSNPDNPVIGMRERSFSELANLVTAHAREFIKAHLAKGIIPVIKHFPGHGSSSCDTHHELVDITNSWRENELDPYNELLKEGLIYCIMTAHVFNRNVDKEYPATLSRRFITELLRIRLGFNGVVITDDLSMNAIKNYYGMEVAVEKAINAGVDILLISYNEIFGNKVVQQMIDLIKNLVDKGIISTGRIEESYSRIKNLKTHIN